MNRDKGNGYKLLIHTIIKQEQLILAQGEDSKVGELIYLLRGVVLMKFIQNEPIPIRNIKEIHRFVPNSKNKHFEYRLAVLSNF